MTQLVMTTPAPAQKPGLVTTSGSSVSGGGNGSGSLPNPHLVSSGGGFTSMNPPQQQQQPPQQQQNGAQAAPGPQQLQAQAATAVLTLEQVQQQQHQQKQRQQAAPQAVKAKQKGKRIYKRPEQLLEERKQTAVANVGVVGALPCDAIRSAPRTPPACCALPTALCCLSAHCSTYRPPPQRPGCCSCLLINLYQPGLHSCEDSAACLACPPARLTDPPPPPTAATTHCRHCHRQCHG
jgi:hypothetical protein